MIEKHEVRVRKRLVTLFSSVMAFAIDPVFVYTELDVVGAIQGNLDVSAISCIDTSRCILASDETNFLQSFEIVGNKMYVSEEEISLGKFKKENDIEGLTNDGRYFYAIGSHGMSRKKGKYQRSRFQVFRVLVSNEGKLLERKVSSLESVLEASDLSGYFKKRLDKNGVDIEGLAYNDGFLYVGFRGPVIDGYAQILRVNAEGLFSQGELEEELFQVDLGENRGIRSLEFNNGKLLAIGGESAVSGEVFSELYEVELNTESELRAFQIPMNDLKVEGFEITPQTGSIFVYDSQENGRPVVQSF